MRVLVVGQGGREHALVWKLARSPRATRVYCAPGNAGTAIDGVNLPIREDDSRELVRFCLKEKVDLVVIGPEAPLVDGLADDLRKEGILVFGPSREAAELEGSKIFAKRLLKKYKVPTGDFRVFQEFPDVEAYLEAHPVPCVVKADGLAAGKGAIVCASPEEALAAARRMLVDEEFGAAGRRILIEETLTGPEISILAVTDGRALVVLAPCQDHKRALDGDQGPNTGGMGAYSPVPLVTDELLANVERDILIPTVHGMRSERRPFQGVLYAGLMLTPSGPKVLEYNVRFGDPECQPILMRLRSDLLDLLARAAKGNLGDVPVEWDERPAVAVVMASGGYPGAYKTGMPIHGLDDVANLEDVMVFHAGTTSDEGRIVTRGGRVLAVTALGLTIAQARESAYRAVERIRFSGAQYRRDIAAKTANPPST